ncbi:hypothetical protein [Streptomyces endophyticus]|uniref:Uncharacterized protein n=1 Tax=Streptomyces endophyticus TaxID=714166 RepID=A0ABU6FME9_9ACTN|nr:hypothetical protein [Streptomyces endophyticus]MEB8343977.1 hypothetical protein [Streptomyces endophyticus]
MSVDNTRTFAALCAPEEQQVVKAIRTLERDERFGSHVTGQGLTRPYVIGLRECFIPVRQGSRAEET